MAETEHLLENLTHTNDPAAVEHRYKMHYQQYWLENAEVVQLSPRSQRHFRDLQYAQMAALKAVQTRRDVEVRPAQTYSKVSSLSEAQQRQVQEYQERITLQEDLRVAQKRERTLHELREQRLLLQQGKVARTQYVTAQEKSKDLTFISRRKGAEHDSNSLKYAKYLQSAEALRTKPQRRENKDDFEHPDAGE